MACRIAWATRFEDGDEDDDEDRTGCGVAVEEKISCSDGLWYNAERGINWGIGYFWKNGCESMDGTEGRCSANNHAIRRCSCNCETRRILLTWGIYKYFFDQVFRFIWNFNVWWELICTFSGILLYCSNKNSKHFKSSMIPSSAFIVYLKISLISFLWNGCLPTSIVNLDKHRVSYDRTCYIVNQFTYMRTPMDHISTLWSCQLFLHRISGAM